MKEQSGKDQLRKAGKLMISTHSRVPGDNSFSCVLGIYLRGEAGN